MSVKATNWAFTLDFEVFKSIAILVLLVVLEGTEIVGIGYFHEILLVSGQVRVLHHLFYQFYLFYKLLILFKILFLVIVTRGPLTPSGMIILPL